MRRIERILAMSVAAMLAVGPISAAPPAALLKASITSASGLPLPGLELRLVSLDTGRRVSGATNASGVFAAELPPGLYSFDTIGSGYTLLRGPRVVSLAAGQMLATSLALDMKTQEGSAAEGLLIQHEPIGCFLAGEFPQIDASVHPAEQFAKGRVYFRSALSPELYSVDLIPSVGGVVGRLPRPRLEASTITYNIDVTGKNFQQGRTSEITGRVVEKRSDCEPGQVVAPISPEGPAAIYGASGLAVAPVGFGGTAAAATATAAAGAGGLSTTAIIITSAVVAGGVIAILATTGDSGAPPVSPSR